MKYFVSYAMAGVPKGPGINTIVGIVMRRAPVAALR
jgi:hypothetical protein